MTICRRCGDTDVFWARTDNGRPMLVDRLPHPKGNVVVEPTLTGEYLAHVLRKDQFDAETRPRLFAHAAYCGKARPPEIDPPVPAQLGMLEPQLVVRDGVPEIVYVTL